MGRFTVHFMTQRAIGPHVSIYVEEETLAVPFRPRGELDVLVDTVQVVKEVPQPERSVWSDGESVHLTEVAEGLMGGLVESHLFQISHEGVDFDSRATP
jgi:hypothetical protein